MDLELITWKTIPTPTDPAKWPCMVCREALATHRRRLHRGHTDINLIVCLPCGRLPDETLWECLCTTGPSLTRLSSECAINHNH